MHQTWQSGQKWKVPLTIERARELFVYEPDTGILRWRKNMKGGKRAGEAAGSVAQHGYVTVRADGKLYYAHRLAWGLVNGEWPPQEIDHVNGQRDDNRWSNIRPASRKEQSGNVRLTRKSASGMRGVYRNRQGNKWIAQIHRDGKQYHLGTFETQEQAAYAYAKAAIAHFGTFARID